MSLLNSSWANNLLNKNQTTKPVSAASVNYKPTTTSSPFSSLITPLAKSTSTAKTPLPTPYTPSSSSVMANNVAGKLTGNTVNWAQNLIPLSPTPAGQSSTPLNITTSTPTSQKSTVPVGATGQYVSKMINGVPSLVWETTSTSSTTPTSQSNYQSSPTTSIPTSAYTPTQNISTPTQQTQETSQQMTTPNVPTQPMTSEAQKAYDLAAQAYENSLKLSPDELSTQEDIDKLIEQTKAGYEAIKGQGEGVATPLRFISGQLSSVERRATNLIEPLENKMARLQSARQASMQASQFALDKAQSLMQAEKDESRYSSEMAEDKRRWETEIALQASGGAGGDELLSVSDAKALGVPYGTTKNQAVSMGVIPGDDKTQDSAGAQYAEEKALRTIQGVDELLQMAEGNEGIFGRTAAAPIPDWLRSDAYRDYSSALDVLKSSIGFGELTEMREASKTGGALGQVSERELALLTNALGALNMEQSPTSIKTQLNKIKESVQRWQEAKNKYSGSATTSGGDSEWSW